MSVVSHQFDDMRQQSEAGRLGMWTFLVTEVLFFGGAFTLYTAYRIEHHAAWIIGSLKMDYTLGTINTGILLISSLTMALGVHAAQHGHRSRIVLWLSSTWILGWLFLAIKFYEYYKHWEEHLVPGAHFAYLGAHHAQVQLFMSFYFIMTGMHAVHMTVGILLVSVLIGMAAAGKFDQVYHTPVVAIGLYWHFVDIVWIFLYPCFYLVGPR